MADFVFRVRSGKDSVTGSQGNGVVWKHTGNGISASLSICDNDAPRSVIWKSEGGLVSVSAGERFSHENREGQINHRQKCGVNDRKWIDIVNEVSGPVSRLWFKTDSSETVVFRGLAGRCPLFVSKTKNRVIIATSPELIRPFSIESLNVDRLRRFLIRAGDRSRETFVEGVCRIRPGELKIFEIDRLRFQTSLWEELRARPASADGYGKRKRRLQHAIRKALDKRRDTFCSRVHTVSGGLDSSLLAAMDSDVNDGGVRAVRLVAPTFPTVYESSSNIRDLKRVCSLKIRELRVDRIKFSLSPKAVEKHLAWGPPSHPSENIHQALFGQLGLADRTEEIALGLDADGLFRVSENDVYEDLIKRFSLSVFASRLATGSLKSNLKTVTRIILKNLGLLQYARGFRSRVSGSNETAVWRRPGFWVLNDEESKLEGRQVTSFGGGANQRLRDYRGWKWEGILADLERHSRMSGIKVSLPFLDREVISAALDFCPSEIAQRGLKKYPLRDIATDYLPESIAMSPKTGVLDEMVEARLRECSEQINSVFSDSLLEKLGVVDSKKFLAAYVEYCKASAERENETEPPLGSFPLWNTYSAEIWLRSVRRVCV